jgi:hypothetical protein
LLGSRQNRPNIYRNSKAAETENETANENEKWNALIPETIWTAAADFQDHYEGEDFDEILDEYDDEKYRLFEQWFFACWKKASEQTHIKRDAYFLFTTPISEQI